MFIRENTRLKYTLKILFLTALPAQCTAYINNSDATRQITYTTVQNLCDSNLTIGWYRFVGAAGTVLSSTYINNPACGALNPGFIGNSVYTNLTNMGQTATVLYCFNHYNVNSCDFIQNITVTYCDNYYVFYIQPGSSSNCDFRYCTS
jgi:hypothetical protein